MTKADSFKALEDLWALENRRRANGGWWALSGFNVQFLISLSIFFRRYFEQDHHDLKATVESVSDFSLEENGRAEFFQIKRTLNKASLASAVREAYEVLSLCTPDLAKRITFRVGYERTDANITLGEIAQSDVFAADEKFDPLLFRDAIKHYDAHSPLVQFIDPLINLKLLFLSAGLRDPSGLIMRSVGRLMTAFNGEDKDAKRAALLDLVSEVQQARPPSLGAERREKIWLDEDLRPGDLSRFHNVSIGARPTLTELISGCYKPRPILEGLAKAVEEWIYSNEATETPTRIPVFWIGGRSGDGKSVLLLQVAQQLLRTKVLPSLFPLSTWTDVSEWLLTGGARSRLYGDDRMPIAVVDDLFDTGDGVHLGSSLSKTLWAGVPKVGLLTCGPSPELARFKDSRLAITHFRIPEPTLEEMEEFKVWHMESTGIVDSKVEASEGKLLVGWLLELAENRSAGEFAQRFKATLMRANIFEGVHTVVTLNVLGIDAPLAAVGALADQHRFIDVVSSNSTYFKCRPSSGYEGWHFAHSALAMPLLRDWSQDENDLLVSLASSLQRAIKVLNALGLHRIVRTIIGRIIDGSTMLELGFENPKLQQRRLLQLLFDAVVRQTESSCLAPALPIWLRVGKLNSLNAEQSVALSEKVAEAFANESISRADRCDIALEYVQSGIGQSSAGPYESALGILFSLPPSHDNARSIARLVNRNRTLLPASLKWLNQNLGSIEFVDIFISLTESKAHVDILDLAAKFVAVHGGEPRVDEVLYNLMKLKYQPLALTAGFARWVATGERTVATSLIFRHILKESDAWAHVITHCVRWVERHNDAPEAGIVFSVILRNDPLNRMYQRLARAWSMKLPGATEKEAFLIDMIEHKNTRRIFQEQAEQYSQRSGPENSLRLRATLVAKFGNIERYRRGLADCHQLAHSASTGDSRYHYKLVSIAMAALAPDQYLRVIGSLPVELKRLAARMRLREGVAVPSVPPKYKKPPEPTPKVQARTKKTWRNRPKRQRLYS